MTEEEAEALIVSLVKKIDRLRASASMSDADKTAAVAQVDSEIRDLKKVTGPRHITGTINR
jgi:uncharacterized membrane protein YukC